MCANGWGWLLAAAAAAKAAAICGESRPYGKRRELTGVTHCVGGAVDDGDPNEFAAKAARWTASKGDRNVPYGLILAGEGDVVTVHDDDVTLPIEGLDCRTGEEDCAMGRAVGRLCMLSTGLPFIW